MRRASRSLGVSAVFAALVPLLAACVEEVRTSCLTSPSRVCIGADLSGVSLAGGSFDGWDFSGADLSGADLSGGSFVGAVFDRASLDGASGAQGVFTGASFFATSALDVVFDGAELSGADMEGTDLRRASLVGAVLRAARLHEVNLSEATLDGADLSESLVARSYLDGTSLLGSRLDSAVFARTDLRTADLTDASWTGSVLRSEDRVPSVEFLPGATVCSARSCAGALVPTSDVLVDVPLPPAEAFRFAALSATRVSMTYGEGPLLVGRNIASAYLAAFGLYPESRDLGIVAWDSVPPSAEELPDGARGVAAIYALQNTAVGLRLSPKGPDFDGRMTDLILAREVTLWELTRSAPQARGWLAMHGVASSARLLERASADGFASRSTVYDGVGEWKPTPPAFVPALEPNWASSVERFLPASRLCAPPAPEGDALVKAEEARAIAMAASDDERAAARFWDDERVRTVTPPGHWVYIAAAEIEPRLISGELSMSEAFATMADLSMVMADTLSQVWEAKYRYRTARPQTVLGESDPQWRSYLTNPPFPSYPSGHAAVSRAAAEVLTAHLGSFAFGSDGGAESAGGNKILNITPRRFDDFLAAAEEAGMSRVWGGIHTLEDFRGGSLVGSCVAAIRVPSGR